MEKSLNYTYQLCFSQQVSIPNNIFKHMAYAKVKKKYKWCGENGRESVIMVVDLKKISTFLISFDVCVVLCIINQF